MTNNMYCDYCSTLNCKKHVKSVCQYCKYTCFTKETFKRHKCSIAEEVRNTQERFKRAAEQIYLDARAEIQQMEERIRIVQEDKNQEVLTLRKTAEQLRDQLRLYQTNIQLDSTFKTQTMKELTEKDTRIATLLTEKERVQQEHQQEILRIHQEYKQCLSELEWNETSVLEKIRTEHVDEMEQLRKTHTQHVQGLIQKHRQELETLCSTHKETLTRSETESKQSIARLTKEVSEWSSKHASEAQHVRQLSELLKREKEQWQTEMKSLRDERNQLHVSLETTQRTHQVEKHRLTREWEDDVHTLRSELEKEKQWRLQVEPLQKQCTELTSERDTLHAKCRTLQTQLTTFHSQMETLRPRLVELEKKEKELQTTLKEQEKKETESRVHYNDMMENMKAQLKEERHKNRMYVDEIQYLKTKSIDTGHLQKLVQEKEKQTSELETNLKSVQSDLRIRNHELQVALKTSREYADAKDTLQGEWKQLKTELGEWQTKYNTVYQQMIHVQKENVEFQKYRERVQEQSQMETDTRNKEMNQLQEQLRVYEKRCRELEPLERMTQQYKMKISELKTDLTITESNYQKFTEKYKTELQHYQQENKQLKDRVRKAETPLTELQHKHDVLREERHRLKEQLQEMEDLQVQLVSAQKTIQVYKNDLQDVMEENYRLKKDKGKDTVQLQKMTEHDLLNILKG